MKEVQIGKDANGYNLYRKNDPRVLGRSYLVQAVKKERKAIETKFLGKAQIIKLPLKYEGLPVETNVS